MKKNHWYLMALVVLVLSCKKEHTNNNADNNGSHKITYNVGFSQSVIGINSAKLQVNGNGKTVHAANDLVDVMYFAVYDATGKNVHTRQAFVNNDTFTYVDTLATGNYTLVVAAGKTGFTLDGDVIGRDNQYNPIKAPSTLNTDVLKYSGDFIQDAFYKKIPLTVTNSDFSQSISLDRITSQIVANIEDAIPANAKWAAMYIRTPAQVGYKFYIGSGTPALPNPKFENAPYNDYYYAFDATIYPADIGTVNYKLYSAPFLYISPFTVNLYFASIDMSPNQFGDAPIIAQRAIPNVTCAPNTQTVLTGYMFGGNPANGSGDFHISVDTTWNSTPIVKKFP